VTSISDLFDEDEYGRALLETLSPTLRRTLRSALASQTEAEFFVSHELRYRDRRPEEWARVVEILRIYAHGRRRLVGSSTESRRRRNRDPRWLGTAMIKDAELRALLATLDSKARDDLRRVLIRDQADRDAIASRLMRYRDERRDNWADIIGMLTMYPGARRRVIRVLGEIDAR